MYLKFPLSPIQMILRNFCPSSANLSYSIPLILESIYSKPGNRSLLSLILHQPNKGIFLRKLFCRRYKILKQRIARHELLNSNSVSEDDSNRIKLQNIDYLISCGGQTVKTIVFGFLSQLKEGKYYLEDPTGILPLDLSGAVLSLCFFLYNKL